MHPYL
jgi:hypothetical protein